MSAQVAHAFVGTPQAEPEFRLQECGGLALVVDDNPDIGMPGMTGHELARALRATPEYQTTPMIAVTGFDMYDDRERSAEAGFSAHLRKPIDPLALTQAV